MDGRQRPIAVVIKNSPFLFVLQYTLPASMQQTDIMFECVLCYGTEVEKPVDYVRICPIEYRSIPCEVASCIAIEMRIKVLTSQLEDSLFKIVFRGVKGYEAIPGMQCESELIRVVSKPEQIKKGKKEDGTKISITPVRMPNFSQASQPRGQGIAGNFGQQGTGCGTAPNSLQLNEIVTNLHRINECISKIQSLQSLQKNNIQRVAKGEASIKHEHSEPSTPTSETGKRQREVESGAGSAQFAKEMNRLLTLYSRLREEDLSTPLEEKEAKIKSAILGALRTEDLAGTLAEICDMCEANGLSRKSNEQFENFGGDFDGNGGVLDLMAFNSNFIL